MTRSMLATVLAVSAGLAAPAYAQQQPAVQQQPAAQQQPVGQRQPAQHQPAAQQSGAQQRGQQAAAYKAKKLTRAELDRLSAQPDRLLLIDVRRPDELTANGGFPVYLSVQFVDLEKSLAWLPKDRTIVTVSNHAARAGRAADLLASKGFTVAGAIGVQDYEAEGGALTKIKAPAQGQTAQRAPSAERK